MSVSRACKSMVVTLALGCPGDLAGTTDTSSSDTADSSAGHSDTGAPTGTTTDAPTSSSTSDPGTTAALDTTGGESTGSTTTGGESTGSTTTGGESTGSTTTGGESTGSTTTSDPGPICGDGVRDPEEQCDDGNDDPGDHCLADCTLGPADSGEALPLALLPEEALTCMTLAGDGLAIGAIDWVLERQNELYAHVQQVPLPDAAPASWSYHEKGGMHGRWAREAATASNGDVIVAGAIFTEFQQPDSGGYLWLARFTAAGALVWSHEFPGQYYTAGDLELGPADEIVVVVHGLVCCGPTESLAVFDPQGQLVWQFTQPDAVGEFSAYGGVTLGDDGTIYVAGRRHHHDDEWNVLDSQVLVRAFAADGAPLWQTEQAAPDLALVAATDIVRTSDDILVVTTPRAEVEFHAILPALALAGFDTTGALLWWREWAPPDPWRAYPDQLVAADDGGVFLVGAVDFAQAQSATLVARFAADGEPVWSKLAPGASATDALLGPDGRLLVLTRDDIRAYPP